MTDTPNVVEMRIADVRRGATGDGPAAHVVVLEEVEGGRRLPIWIGPQEAGSLAMLLENIDIPRPLAPQFLVSALQAVGARVVEVRIDRLAESTYYAVAVIEAPDGASVEVDARPSDALNVALLAGARVTVRADVLIEGGETADAVARAGWPERFPETARDIVPS